MSVLRKNRTSPTGASPRWYLLWIVSLSAVLATAAGCAHTSGAVATPPLQVEVADVEQRDVPLYKEWIGTLDGLVNADIKAEVSGYLIKQAYTEGTFVKQGQLLVSDRSPAVPGGAGPGARPAWRSRRASWSRRARSWLRRKPEWRSRRPTSAASSSMWIATRRWRKQQAITQQDLDNATQNNMAAKAQLQAARAQVETSQGADHGRSRRGRGRQGRGGDRAHQSGIHAPHFAHRRHSRASPSCRSGALVSPASGAITTVSTVDPIKVYFTVSEQEYLEYTRRFPTAEKRQANSRHAGTRVDSRRRDYLSAQRQVLFRGPPGGRPHRRHPAGGPVPEPRQQPASRPVRQGAHRNPGADRARCWFRSRPSSTSRARTSWPWSIAHNKVTIRRRDARRHSRARSGSFATA